MTDISYKKNTLNQNTLYQFVKNSDKEFEPVLSMFINLEDYCKKIQNNAEIFEAFSGNKIAALVIMYANDYESKKAFITYVYCKQEYRKQGITGNLLKNAVIFAKDKGFTEIWLNCNPDNISALKLYKKYGFIEKERLKKQFVDKIKMIKYL